MDIREIRRRVIVAMFSDKALVGRFALKGGNALELVHHVLTRGSVDIDLSIETELTDIEDTKDRIFHALRSEFETVGCIVFDETFVVVPPAMLTDDTPWWGGYLVEFKLIEQELADALDRDLEKMRIQAQTFDPRHGRKFRVDISKHEYCAGKVAAELDGRTIYVYTEEMCAIEKLRAICQQMPDYGRTNPTPRARDFYDIYAIVTRRAVDLSLPENLELFRHIFGAKRVPLALLARISESREFHRPDWDAVRDSVQGVVFEFDIYFDFVLDQVSRLEALRNE